MFFMFIKKYKFKKGQRFDSQALAQVGDGMQGNIKEGGLAEGLVGQQVQANVDVEEIFAVNVDGIEIKLCKTLFL